MTNKDLNETVEIIKTHLKEILDLNQRDPENGLRHLKQLFHELESTIENILSHHLSGESITSIIKEKLLLYRKPFPLSLDNYND